MSPPAQRNAPAARHADIDDNLQYDLVVNPVRISQREVAHLIGEAVTHWAGTL